tara:strand:+ start:1867 stop:2061 length:195 start_codon:yes stop_codon:yes gene_type:complete
MVTIPLIRSETDANVTPIERTTLACEQVITALMMQATLDDPTVSQAEREVFTTLSVATIIPAEA